MASKPFISARIPEDLLEQLESHVDATGESKTEVLVEALTEYLNPKNSSSDGNSSLERQMRHFEHWLIEKVGRLENKVNDLEESKKDFYLTVEAERAKALSTSSERRQPRLMPTDPSTLSC